MPLTFGRILNKIGVHKLHSLLLLKINDLRVSAIINALDLVCFREINFRDACLVLRYFRILIHAS